MRAKREEYSDADFYLAINRPSPKSCPDCGKAIDPWGDSYSCEDCFTGGFTLEDDEPEGLRCESCGNYLMINCTC